MFTPWNESCPGEHLSFGSFAIPLAQNLSHRSHAIPLGFTPWNSFSACLLAKSDLIGGDRLDLVNRGSVIPLGPTPCNACPVGSGNPTGVESFLFLSRSMLYAPCAMLVTPLGLHAPYALCYALCPLRHALYAMHHACPSTGVRPFLKKASHKAPLNHNEGGAFLFEQ